MALGPELIFAVSGEVAKSFAQNKIRKVEAFDNWLSLTFSRDRILLFSWDSEFYGCPLASPDEIRELSHVAASKPPIINAVKSHLLGAELMDASAVNRDRVLSISFRRPVGAGVYQIKYLLFEASGRYSNLMILDENQKIIEAAKHIHPDTNRYRSTLPGSVYIPPPAINGIPIDRFELHGREALEKIDSITGIGKPLISAVRRTCEEPEADCGEIIAGLSFFKTAQTTQAQPEVVYQTIGNYVTLFPVLLNGAVRLEVRDALEAARHCVVSPLLHRHLERLKKSLRAHLAQHAKINDRKIRESERLLADEAAAEQLLLYGKLILANAWAIPPRASEADLTEWTETGELQHRVSLDPQKDAPQNAERYFTKYKKKRAAIERAKKLLSGLYLERDELQEQEALLECHTSAATLLMMMEESMPEKHGKQPKGEKGAQAREQPLPPHKRFQFDWANAALYIGLSAKGNHYLTFRLAKSGDTWLHAQNIPGAHVILRFQDQPDEETRQRMLEIAAAGAAYYSKGRSTGRVRVDYTERKHVRAITGGGPAQVTYKEFSTISADVSIWADVLESLEENPSDRRAEEP